MKIVPVAFMLTSLILTGKNQQPVPSDDGAQRLHHYMLAQYKTAEGSLQAASNYYEQLMTHSAIPIAAYKGYTQFLLLNNQYPKIVEMIPKLDAAFADDATIQLAIVDALDHIHQHKEAVERLLMLSQKNQANQEITFKAAQVYVAQQELENAIHVIDRFLDNTAQKPNLFIFHFLKAQILLQLNKKQEALDAIKKCIKTHAHFDKGWLMYAMLEEQLGNLEGAIKGFSTFLDLVGQDNAIQTHLLSLMFKQKMIAEKTTELKVSAPCIQKAMLLFEQKQPKAALEQLEECLKKAPKDPEARLLKIQLLGALGQLKNALVCLADWITQDPSHELWYKTLLLMTNHGILHSDAIRALQAIEKKHPQELLPVQYIADLYLRTEQQGPALQYLNKIVSMSKDQLLCAKAYYQMSCIYYDQRKFDTMTDLCQKGLACKADFAPLCNLLAYYYAGKGHNLEQAQKLITIALAQDADNPHYKDTQSYIYYKSQDYTKAAQIIESISSQLANDPHITRHASKIHIKLAQHR